MNAEHESNKSKSFRLRFAENDLTPLSGLNQFLYCQRRFALIHIERMWDENRFTAEGRIMHEKVHEQDDEMRSDLRISRALPLRSLKLGLSGIADVVEFHREEGSDVWRPFPVEYKHGKPKMDASDTVQLCAQAICLEEMLGIEVPRGALFYGKTRRRLDVVFDEELQMLTTDTARRLHELIRSGKTPLPKYEARCEKCSLLDSCMPKEIVSSKSARKYIQKMLEEEQAQA